MVVYFLALWRYVECWPLQYGYVTRQQQIWARLLICCQQCRYNGAHKQNKNALISSLCQYNLAAGHRTTQSKNIVVVVIDIFYCIHISYHPSEEGTTKKNEQNCETFCLFSRITWRWPGQIGSTSIYVYIFSMNFIIFRMILLFLPKPHTSSIDRRKSTEKANCDNNKIAHTQRFIRYSTQINQSTATCAIYIC